MEADGFVIVKSSVSGSEDVVCFLIVFQLKIEIFNNFICSFHFFVVNGNFLIESGLDADELFYLCDILCPARPN